MIQEYAQYLNKRAAMADIENYNDDGLNNKGSDAAM